MTTDFDRAAASWDDDPSKVERARVIAEAIRVRVPLAPDACVAEFGAGTGLVGLQVAPEGARLVLADAAQGMIDVARGKIAAHGLRGVEAVRLEAPLELIPYGPFDLVLSAMALHHVEDVDQALEGLRATLVPGGYVAIADLCAEDGSFHGEGFTGHNGFATEEFHAALERAGFRDVTIETVHSIVRADRGGRAYPVFLATGRR